MLISPEHQKRYQDYYAARSIEPRRSIWLRRVDDLARQLGVRSIIDYGCGAASGLAGFSDHRVIEYDPGIPRAAAIPEPADLVVSIHALEHVEPESINEVIAHMEALALKALFIVVSCESSTKQLPDGAVWHSFVRDAEWWRQRLDAYKPQLVIAARAGAEYAALRLK